MTVRPRNERNVAEPLGETESVRVPAAVATTTLAALTDFKVPITSCFAMTAIAARIEPLSAALRACEGIGPFAYSERLARFARLPVDGAFEPLPEPDIVAGPFSVVDGPKMSALAAAFAVPDAPDTLDTPGTPDSPDTVEPAFRFSVAVTVFPTVPTTVPTAVPTTEPAAVLATEPAAVPAPESVAPTAAAIPADAGEPIETRRKENATVTAAPSECLFIIPPPREFQVDGQRFPINPNPAT
jgi:hypothetical protein